MFCAFTCCFVLLFNVGGHQASPTATAQGYSHSSNRRNEMAKPNLYNLSISVANRSFSPSQQAKVIATIENRSTHKLDLSSVIFKLSTHKKELPTQRTNETFGSSFPLVSCSAVSAGASCRFEVRLENLYWEDVFANSTNLSRPKNMFDVIRHGQYYLSMEFSLPAVNSTRAEPRTIIFQSNDILVTVN